MDYRQLSYFLAVCDYANMTAAAAAVHISEQALSRSIRNLEKELHAQLFIRGARSMTLTDAGRNLLCEARPYVERHEAIVSRFSRTGRDDARSLNICASTGAFTEWLPDGFLSHFFLDHPKTRFELRCFPEDSYNRPQHAGDADLLFCNSVVFPTDWEVLLHAKRPFRVLMSGDDELASKRVLVPADLAGRPFAVSIEQTPGQYEIRRILEGAGCVPVVHFGSSEIPFVIEMVAGSGLLSAFYGSDAQVPPGITARRVEGIDTEWHFFGLKRRNTQLSPIAREFVGAVRGHLDS